ncbi:MAG: hypothetical protein FJ358_07325 [Thaumarchaeota archaeon]|nr:hypothetical protein [Nitrososphaerota archaeon]
MKSTYAVALIALIVGGIWLEWISLSLMFPVQAQVSSAIPTTVISIDGGETSRGFGFALQGQQIVSPGPTITVKSGDVVKVNFKNVGATAHAFAVTKEKDDKSPTLFKSNVGTGARPLTPESDSSVVFKVDTPGTYYYICPVPGHPLLGMWGEFKVEG